MNHFCRSVAIAQSTYRENPYINLAAKYKRSKEKKTEMHDTTLAFSRQLKRKTKLNQHATYQIEKYKVLSTVYHHVLSNRKLYKIIRLYCDTLTDKRYQIFMLLVLNEINSIKIS